MKVYMLITHHHKMYKKSYFIGIYESYLQKQSIYKEIMNEIILNYLYENMKIYMLITHEALFSQKWSFRNFDHLRVSN